LLTLFAAGLTFLVQPAKAASTLILSNSGRLVGGAYWIYGEFENLDASPVKCDKVTATFYDSNNNLIAIQKRDNSFLSPGFLQVVLPNKKSPFFVMLDNQTQASRVDHYTLEVTTSITSATPLDLRVLTNSSSTDLMGYLHLTGELENAGTTNVTFPKVFVTCYDSNGTVIYNANYIGGSDAILPGQKTNFEIIIGSTWAPLVKSYIFTPDSYVAGTTTPTPTPSVNSAPVGYWKFDEGSGITTSDNSGNGNDGLLKGPIWAAGQTGQALSFDGLNDYVEFANEANFHTVFDGHHPFTVSLWMNFRDTNFCNIWTKGYDEGEDTPPTGGYATFYATNGHLLVSIKASVHDAINVQTNDAYRTNVWEYWTVTYDGSGSYEGIKVYGNGLERQMELLWGESLNNSLVNTVPFRLGGKALENIPDGQSYYNGLLDEVKVYSRVLTEQEIIADMQAPSVTPTATPTTPPSPTPTSTPTSSPSMSTTLEQLVAVAWVPPPEKAAVATAVTIIAVGVASVAVAAAANAASASVRNAAVGTDNNLATEGLKKWLSDFTSSKRKPPLDQKKGSPFKMTKAEAVAYGVSLVVLTLSFSYVKVPDFTQILAVIPTILATAVVVEFVKTFCTVALARSLGVWTEHRLWYFGLAMFVITTFAFGIPFSSPSRSLYHAPQFTKRREGIVASVAILVTIGFAGLFFALLVSGFTLIGSTGLAMCVIMAFLDTLPISPMNGKAVYDHSKAASVALFAGALAIYISWLLFL
jgi:hypothetical protein